MVHCSCASIMKAATALLIVAVCASLARVRASSSHDPFSARPARHHRPPGKRPTTLQRQSHSLTIVSAFYDGPAKHSGSEYAQWGANFMRMRAPVVFFTDGTTSIPAGARTRPRDSIHIILKHPDDFYVSSLGIDWDAQLEIDPERHIHSVHLFRVWLEKTNFVMEATRTNPFQSNYFAWIDYGYFRRKGDPPWAPTPACMPPGKMLLLNTSSLPFNSGKVVGGGAMAGDVKTWQAWNRTFYNTLVARVGAGEFVGDDQTTMTRVVLTRPGLVCLVHPVQGYGDVWFSLQAVLDGRAGKRAVEHCFL